MYKIQIREIDYINMATVNVLQVLSYVIKKAVYLVFSLFSLLFQKNTPKHCEPCSVSSIQQGGRERGDFRKMGSTDYSYFKNLLSLLRLW